jgi:adenine-specific DNA-methyltransferase
VKLLNYRYECTDALEFMKKMPEHSVKLIITSPPYNVGKEYETRAKIEEYLENMKPIISEMYRILSDDGSVCWQVGNYVDHGEIFPLDIYYYFMFKELGLKLRNRIIWHFGHGLHCKNRFSGRYETILWFTKSDQYTFNLDDVRIPSKYPGKRSYKGDKKGQPSGNRLGKNPEDVWELTLDRLYDDWDSLVWDIPNVKSNHPEKEEHPCQFPIELVERCVLALTDEGDLVYDPFAGVGSALLGALKNNRRAYGTELESQYVKIGLSRIDRLKNNMLKVRPIYQKIHTPKGNEKVSQIPDEWKVAQ